MSRPVIWIPRRLSDATLERAQHDYDCIINWDDELSSADEIIAMSAKVDGIIPCHSEHFSAEVAARLDSRLKIIANHSVGVDHCSCSWHRSANGRTCTQTISRTSRQANSSTYT